jgi:peptidoglycan hydrolase-like protein with peptidoglycan-binding domain
LVVRLVVVVLAALVFAPAAAAAPPLTVRASATLGAAPFRVTLTAEGSAASYEWDLGDGQRAFGSTVEHVYERAGIYTATVTATSADGATARAQLVLTAVALELVGPAAPVRYRKRIVLHGRLAPPIVGAPITLVRQGQPVASTTTGPDGAYAFRLRAFQPGPYVARFAGVDSAALPLRVRPQVRAHLVGARAVGTPLRLEASARPRNAGSLVVEVWRGKRKTFEQTLAGKARVGLRTRGPASFRIRVTLVPSEGFIRVVRTLKASVVRPHLSLGSRGRGVRALEARLADLHYALERTDGLYGTDTYDAVLAFQKVRGLPRTGLVDARVWRALASATVPPARYGGNHVEISKGRQVLFLVRGGKVVLIVHVSTGATGNTPIGSWHVYRKVVGWSWILWYPMYFLRGFAIHGYPFVPAYPASHGCVRVPMWVAPRLFAEVRYGETVDVYW